MILTAASVLVPAGPITDGWVEVTGDRVTGAGGGVPPAPADRHLPGTLVPGFVDMHCHGGGGAAFTSGTAAEAERVIATHRSHGTTSLMASLVTYTVERLEETVRSLRPLVAAGDLVGIHLEGPWLSSDHCGAHDPALLRAPRPADVDRLIDAGGGAIRMVTLAPELDGGVAAVKQLVERGVTAALGHTDARYAVAREALDAGVTVGTHLFNAMRGLHHREPGPVLALLEDERAVVEVIADGIHLRPEILAWAARSAPGRFALITDAMGAAGARDGRYVLGPLEVEVRDSVARLVSNGAIAGSTLTMDRAVRYAVEEGGIGLREAVRAATATPAQALGLQDVGLIAPGCYADLVVLDNHLAVAAVMRRGEWIA